MSANTKEIIKKGTVLFLQGETPQEYYFVQSGALEILVAPEDYTGLDKDIIVSKSNRVGIVKGKTIITGMSYHFIQPSRATIRTISDCEITKYPLQPDGFKHIVKTDTAQTGTILRQVYNRLNISIADVAKFSNLYKNVCIVSDNLALMHKELSQRDAPPELEEKAADLHSQYIASGKQFPATFSAKFLIANNGEAFKKDYSIPGNPFESLLQKDFCNFIKRFLKLPPPLLEKVISTDPGIALSMCDILSDDLMIALERFEDIYRHIDDEFSQLIGNGNSWAEFLTGSGGFNDWIESEKIDASFIKNFLSIFVKINSAYEDISGKKITAIYPGLKKIHEYFVASSKKTQQPVQSTEENVSGSNGESKIISAPATIGTAFDKSIHQIFEFSLIDKEFQNKFLKLLNDFKTMKNPFNTEQDGRKIRRQISKLYWDIYKQTYIRSKTESSTPKVVKFLLNYGFLDNELVEDAQLAELNELAMQREKSEIPILFETEFLNNVYSGEEIPSITEMGLTYEAYLRDLEKHSRKKKGQEGSDQNLDENLKKTIYEIEQRLASTAAVCSGSTSTAFPILTSHIMKGSLKSVYSSKDKIETIIKDIQTIDFSVFYRETVLKLGEAREIIQEEILPYIILLPIFGTRTLLWQELSGTNKRTRGRIVIPIFFMGDLRKSLAHTLACFRWELNRTMKGAMWADPIDGGVTGQYFDYVNTYKKNSKLSSEAKEKIKERFRSLRTNRDRFAEDYLMWVLYEKEGIMKLNTVVRDMFFRYIPFNKDIRTGLENMPAFSQAANRFKNISNRTITGFERRFKKYQDENGNHPDKIAHFMEFLKK